MINVCGEKPGQLIRLIRPENSGELMDCRRRVIARSMGKEGVVLTRIVNVVNAPTSAIRPISNRYVRYSRLGREVASAFAACSAAPFTFSTGLLLACSAIGLSFTKPYCDTGSFTGTGETGAGN